MDTLASSMHSTSMHTTLVVVRISRTQYGYIVWLLRARRVEKKPYELHHVP